MPDAHGITNEYQRSAWFRNHWWLSRRTVVRMTGAAWQAVVDVPASRQSLPRMPSAAWQVMTWAKPSRKAIARIDAAAGAAVAGSNWADRIDSGEAAAERMDIDDRHFVSSCELSAGHYAYRAKHS
jgi:hypothetical protein